MYSIEAIVLCLTNSKAVISLLFGIAMLWPSHELSPTLAYFRIENIDSPCFLFVEKQMKSFEKHDHDA